MSSFLLTPMPAIDEEVGPTQAEKLEDACSAPTKWFFLIIGWVSVTLGFIGVFVPLMPTTVFLIIALWCFSKSSPRLAAWLYNHPKFGPTLQDWHEHKVVPLRAKAAATILMLMSLGLVCYSNAGSSLLITVVAAAIAVVLTYLLSRPHERPFAKEDK